MNNKRFLAWFLLGLLSLIWGSSFILIKRGLEVFSSDEVAVLRIATAALPLIFLAIPQFKTLTKNQWFYLILVGLLSSLIPSFLFAIAQTKLESSVAGILNALTPFSAMLVGLIIYKQKTNRNTVIGLLVGFIGSIILILGSSPGRTISLNYYALLVILATICYGFNANIVKFKLNEVPTLTITSVSISLVGFLSITYLFLYTDFTSKMAYSDGAWFSFTAIAILGVIGTAIAWIMFNKLVKLTSPVFTTSVTYIVPVIAVIWGLFDSEKLYFSHYLGMSVVLIGVYLTNKKFNS